NPLMDAALRGRTLTIVRRCRPISKLCRSQLEAGGERFPRLITYILQTKRDSLRWKNQAFEGSPQKRSLKSLQSETRWVKYEVQPGTAVPGPLERATEGLGKPQEFRGSGGT